MDYLKRQQPANPYSNSNQTRRHSLLPLSFAQQVVWQTGQRNAAVIPHVTARFRLHGKLNRRALLRSLDRIIARHATLRTVFPTIAGEPAQEAEPADIGFPLIEQRAESDSAVEQVCRMEATSPFDLRAGPLVRGRLLRRSKTDHVLLITLHPIVADRRSVQVLRRELIELYEASALGRNNPLPPLEFQYAEYAQWQQQQLTEEMLNAQVNYWTNDFSAVPGQLQLPTDWPRTAARNYRCARLGIQLSRELTDSLNILARRNDVTPLIVVLAGWSVVLSRWSGQQQVLVGSRFANRPHPELEALVGPFESVCPVSMRFQDDPTISQLLKQTKATMADVRSNQEASAPSVQVLIELNEQDTQTSLSDLVLRTEQIKSATIPFEICLSLFRAEDGLTGAFEYASALYSPETIERMSASWQTVLAQMVEGDERRVSLLSLLTASEYVRVVRRFNATQSAYPHELRISDLFEAQAIRTPDANAVLHDSQSVTYADLNRQANQLARYLRDKGVRADQLVGICVERSIDMVVGLLGILKAGGAYLPLDPNYPRERLQHMLEDAAPRVVLTQESLIAVLPASQAEAIALDARHAEIVGYSDEPVSDEGLSSADLVYVIYTSGSTGRPKGTAMSNRSMVNLIEWHRSSFPDSEGTRVLQFAALSFDVAFQETFSTLCTGGTLVLLDEWLRRDSRALLNLLSDRSIERLFIPPVMLQSLAESFRTTGTVPQSLRDVITAGEQLRISPEITALFGELKDCRLHNHYGPTESHVVTSLTLSGDPAQWPVLPAIGKPIANTQIYVLDAHRRPAPIGVAGEIYIGGANVARGYLGRKELTAQRFVDDRYSAEADARLYRTGDLGRWRSDGMLEYLGRNDDQVKIRGFRIELGEIESHLALHEQVRESVVIAREDIPGEKRLVAYVTRRDDRALNAEDLRAHISALVPEYMVPSAFVFLDALPLSPNGKIDRRALPAPDAAAFASRQYNSPQGEIEEALAEIWQTLLRIDRVGRDDNFFKLGGNSLSMVHVMEGLRQRGLSIDVRSVFESATLADLASVLLPDTVDSFEIPPNLIPSGCDVITPQMLPLVKLEPQHIRWISQSVPGGVGNIQDIYPLAPLQEGILFHHLFNTQQGDTYVLPILLSLSSREKLETFISALQEVIDRHDVLRTAVLWEQLPKPVQVVYREATLQTDVVTLDRARDPIAQLQERMRPEVQRLDVRQAPLMRLEIAADPQSGQWFALLKLHHLACDHESLDTMLAEVMACVEGRSQDLPEPVAYRNHVAQAVRDSLAQSAENFFRHKLADVVEATAPFGLLDVRGDSTRIEEARQFLDPVLAGRVRTQAKQLNMSPAALFHAAWGLVVSRTSGRDDVVFGTLLSGRLLGSAGVQRILGMFINTLPLRLRLEGLTAQELVLQTQRELVELLDHEQASLAVAQRCSGLGSSAPLFNSLLNYLHSTPLAEADGIRVLALNEWSNYPISLLVDDQTEGFLLTAQTDRLIEPRRVLDYISMALQSLTDALETSPERQVAELPILPESEVYQITSAFNATDIAYPDTKVVHELFEEQARRHPDSIALTYRNASLTYAELNRRSNQVAHFLRTKGIGRDCLVGLCMERSIEMIVALLGILKAGGAYVPLDPAYPAERLAYMLRDCNPSVLFIQEKLRNALPETAAQIVALDSEWNAISANSAENLAPAAIDLRPDSLAYVIYTSGSTGQPKGVMLEHQGLCNLATMQARAFSVGTESRVLQFSSLSFDACTWECVMALCAGACLCLAPREELVPGEPLKATLQNRKITHATLPPVALSAIESSDGLEALRTLVVAGEACPAKLVERWAPGRQFVNAYGPTETTVCASMHVCVINEAGSPPIGKPISNSRIYILNTQHQLVPKGVAGEICVGGVSVARGYLNRPELTAERFIKDPFSADADARLYKTGDLGRWREDGAIDYLGRNDHQVKIRGFRIELEEIALQLEKEPSIREAVVIAREDAPGEKRLVAYVTLRDPGRFSVEAVRTHLSARVPEYMLPGAIVTLESFPVTPNGKLDKLALPAPELSHFVSRQYEPPQGEAEEVLAGIWRELLGVPQVGRKDSFFDLGGHSLLATQLTVRIRVALSVEVPVSVVFENVTLSELAVQIKKRQQARVIDRIQGGGMDIRTLLESVDSMPEHRVRELVQALRMQERM